MLLNQIASWLWVTLWLDSKSGQILNLVWLLSLLTTSALALISLWSLSSLPISWLFSVSGLASIYFGQPLGLALVRLWSGSDLSLVWLWPIYRSFSLLTYYQTLVQVRSTSCLFLSGSCLVILVTRELQELGQTRLLVMPGSWPDSKSGLDQGIKRARSDQTKCQT